MMIFSMAMDEIWSKGYLGIVKGSPRSTVHRPRRLVHCCFSVVVQASDIGHPTSVIRHPTSVKILIPKKKHNHMKLNKVHGPQSTDHGVWSIAAFRSSFRPLTSVTRRRSFVTRHPTSVICHRSPDIDRKSTRLNS